MSKFWNFKNISDSEGELLLYGYIAESSWWDDVVSSKQFAKDLKDLGDIKNLTVRINSGGGDVFAGHAIYQLLNDHPANVIVKVDGLAASAASVVAMAGNEIIVPATSFMMIHNPSSVAWGEAKDFEKMAETLNVIKDGIVNAYVAKTGKDKKAISKMMDEETWMTGEDAVKEGFADKVSSDEPVTEPVLNGKLLIINSVSHDLSKFKTIPNVKQMLPSAPQAAAPKPQSDANIIPQGKGEPPMFKDVNELRNGCPDLVKQIEDAAREEGKKSERTRIQDIEKISKNITPELVNKAKFEEPMDAKDLAFQAMQADAGKGTQYLANAEKDADESGANKVPAAPVQQSTAEEKKEAENKAVDSIAAGGNKRRGR
jgi:ATP-dependent Clp protease, protease subunit